jgi:hypothetical protein
MNKTIIVGAIAFILAGFGIGYGVFGNKVTVIETIGQAVSSAGVSNTTARIASVTVAPALTAGTTTSIYNGSGVDRLVQDSFVACTGVGTSQTYLTGAGLAAWTLQMSTSSSALDAKTNTNYVANITVATSSAWSYVASSTEGVLQYVSRIWPTATYLNITFNATNTAACTVGASYLSL